MILSDNTIRDWHERFPRMSHIVEGAGGEKTFGAVLQAIEVVGVAGTMSYMNSRHAAAGRRAYEVAGVPADLALGLLFSGLATFTGYFGSQASHVNNIGSGFLCAYACRMGTMWGSAARDAKDQALAGGVVRGAFAPPASPYAAQPQQQTAGSYPWAA
jgi:hypothetical protein